MMAIPAILTAIGAAASGASVATVVFLTVAQLALGLAGKLLAPSAKSGASTADTLRRDRTHSFRQAITARSWVYGEKRNAGPFVFIKTENGNELLHLVIPVSASRVRRLPAIFVNEEPIHSFDLSSDVVNLGKYKDRLLVMFHTGEDTQVANSRLVNTFSGSEFGGWTNNHTLSGVSYIYVRLTWNAELFGSIPAISCWVRGKFVKELRTVGEPLEFNKNPALILRDYLITPTVRGGFGAKEEDIDDDSFITAANICDEFVGVELENQQAINASASANAIFFDLPICPFATGDRVRITSTESLPGGTSDTLDYYVGQVRPFGITYPQGPVGLARNSPTGINLYDTYANALDGGPTGIIDFTDNGAGTITITKNAEPRYACDGIVNTDQDPMNIIEDILSSMAGRLTYVGGKWRVYAGAYEPSTKTLTEDDLRAPVSVQTKHSRRERFNAVKGVFSSFLTKDVLTSYPVVTNNLYQLLDGGDPLFTEMDLPFTARPVMAQRLAKIALERHRQEITVSFPAKLTAIDIAVGEVIALNLSRFGWSPKEFEVTSWTLVSEQGEGDTPILGVNLTLRETAAGVYDWNLGEETKYDLALDSDLPNAFNVLPPNNLVLESGDAVLDVRQDGTVFSRLKVSWNLPNDFYVQSGGQIEIYYKRGTSSEWNKHFRVPGNSTFAYILDVKDNELYDVAVRSINFLGRYSDEDANPSFWQAVSFNHLVEGKSLPPPSLDLFSVVRLGDGTRRFEWTQNNLPADVRAGGGCQIRYSVGSGGFWENMIDLNKGLITDSPYETNEPAAGLYTFAAKLVDSSNNESTSALFLETTLGEPRLRNIIHAQDEFSRGWPGVKVDCFVDNDNFLSPISIGGWDDLAATWDGLSSSWLTIMPHSDPIVYTTEEIDLGQNSAFTPLITVDGVGSAVIEMQIGTQDDGAAIGAFIPTEPVSGIRYLKIKVTMSGFGLLIRNITTFLDGETQVEEYSDVVTSDSAQDPAVFEWLGTGHFKIATRGRTAFITSAQITAFINAGSGWTWELVTKETFINSGTPAAEFRIYQNGSPAEATIDVVIKGPKS